MQTPLRERRGPQAGITLVELLVAMVIFTIITTMLVGGWISLQRSYAFTVQTNTARATVRDALDRISSEIRSAQPLTMGTPSPMPTSTFIATPGPIFTVARPMEVDFYSSYNQPGTVTDGSGTGALRLTRIYLDTVSGSTPQKALYWQRRPATSPTSGAWTDAGVRTVKLATSVVNNSIPNPNPTPATSYTAIFTYYYRDGSGSIQNADTITANLATIISVRVRLIADVNLAHAPKYVDLSTTLRPRNANLN